ncbi:CopD family protein [Castellaniella sp. GW247-6E4]|uniref:CopD family protein n=1 Tax=Castellaniella sp. GW247-6E4 TaxID=3140380 RepID=UPI003315AF70
MTVLWVKTLHILFVVAWFAGLFYLPRIYVNLAQTADPGARAVLLGMARRLYRFMTPLAVLAVLLGLWLYLGWGVGRGQLWMHVKLAAVAALVAYHLLCLAALRRFERGSNTHGHRYFRWFNEIPVLLLLLILAMVVIKPF